MAESGRIPTNAYGILRREAPDNKCDEIVDQVRRLGYAKVSSGLDAQALDALREEFERVRTAYVARHGEAQLRAADEVNGVRALCAQGSRAFIDLAMNSNVHGVVSQLIEGLYILNQQNGVINPPRQNYNQGAWHRDLPYQHFTSSTPLAVNALFCLDDFTPDNGSTFVLPGSHKAGSFPSEAYVESHALQVMAKAGEFILLDCMVFHSGSYNRSEKERRAINHVFNIPYFKQQIDLTAIMNPDELSEKERLLFGFSTQPSLSVESYLTSRQKS